MYLDYHVHTAYSDDSQYPMEQVVCDAIDLGITELCFCDHVDYGIKRDWNDPRGMQYRPGGPGEPEWMPLANIDHPRYAQEIAALRDRYAGQLTLKMGAEFGMQTHTIPDYQRLFQRFPYDFILLSLHQIENKEFWTQEFQQGRTQPEYNLRYYEELLTLTKAYKDYSVLGHMDLITRYDTAGPFPFTQRKEILTEILKTVITDGKGIEVNTSCYRYGLPDLTPARDILHLYRELGGTILTIGSDSHKKSHLGFRIPETLAQLKDMGFRYICTFSQMEPTFLPL